MTNIVTLLIVTLLDFLVVGFQLLHRFHDVALADDCMVGVKEMRCLRRTRLTLQIDVRSLRVSPSKDGEIIQTSGRLTS